MKLQILTEGSWEDVIDSEMTITEDRYVVNVTHTPIPRGNYRVVDDQNQVVKKQVQFK